MLQVDNTAVLISKLLLLLQQQKRIQSGTCGSYFD
jgi:hypothetical protein